MDDDRPLLPFVAIATVNEKKELKVESSFCTSVDDSAYLRFVNQKLASLEEVCCFLSFGVFVINLCLCFERSMGIQCEMLGICSLFFRDCLFEFFLE